MHEVNSVGLVQVGSDALAKCEKLSTVVE